MKKYLLPISIMSGFIIIGFLLYNHQQNNFKMQRQKIARDMMFECEKYGLNKYGETLEFVSSFEISRHYYFSQKINACIAEISRKNSENNFFESSIINMNTQETLFTSANSDYKNKRDEILNDRIY